MSNCSFEIWVSGMASHGLPARLFLNNVVFACTQAQLFQALQAFGLGRGIKEIHIVRKGQAYPDKKCQAYVIYEEMASVLRAVEVLDGMSLPGVSKYPLMASIAAPRRLWVEGDGSLPKCGGHPPMRPCSGPPMQPPPQAPAAVRADVRPCNTWMDPRIHERSSGLRPQMDPRIHEMRSGMRPMDQRSEEMMSGMRPQMDPRIHEMRSGMRPMEQRSEEMMSGMRPQMDPRIHEMRSGMRPMDQRSEEMRSGMRPQMDPRIHEMRSGMRPMDQRSAMASGMRPVSGPLMDQRSEMPSDAIIAGPLMDQRLRCWYATIVWAFGGSAV